MEPALVRADAESHAPATEKLAAEPPAKVPPYFGAMRASWIAVCYFAAQLATMVFVMGAVGVARALNEHSAQLPRMDAASTLTVGAFGVVLGTLLAYHMVRQSFSTSPTGEFENTLGLRAVPASALGVSALIGFGLALTNATLVTRWFPPSETDSLGPLVAAVEQGGWGRTVCCLFAVVLAPPAEEFVFRGVLFSGFARRWGMPIAASLATLVFVSGHVAGPKPHWPALVAVGLLGTAAQAARIMSGSLAPGLLMHFTYNACLMLPTLFAPIQN